MASNLITLDDHAVAYIPLGSNMYSFDNGIYSIYNAELVADAVHQEIARENSPGERTLSGCLCYLYS